MTTQPTAPWTPERALAMFKDWNDPDLTMHEFCEKWYVAYNPDDFARIAIEALESATAEIERQRARADATEIGAGLLRDKLQVEIAEVERLKAERDEWLECVRAMLVAAGAPEDIDEMERVVKRVGSKPSHYIKDVIFQLKADLAKAQQDYERCVRGQNQLHERVDQLHKAQQQQPGPLAVPSDEEITGAIGCVATWEGKKTAHALMLIAQRIGVQP